MRRTPQTSSRPPWPPCALSGPLSRLCVTMWSCLWVVGRYTVVPEAEPVHWLVGIQCGAAALRSRGTMLQTRHQRCSSPLLSARRCQCQTAPGSDMFLDDNSNYKQLNVYIYIYIYIFMKGKLTNLVIKTCFDHTHVTRLKRNTLYYQRCRVSCL